MSNPSHSRSVSSSSEDDNPYDTPENYYGPKTNPVGAGKNSKLGKVRTFSVFEPKRSQFFDDYNPGLANYDPGLANSDVTEQPDKETSPFSDSPTPEVECKWDFKQSSGLAPLTGKKVDDIPSTHNPKRGNRNSIVPIYEDISLDSVEDFNASTKPDPKRLHYRRASMDDTFLKPRKFYINDIDLTLKELLKNEDTDHNFQITIEDNGPKVIKLGTANSNGYRQAPIRGTYMLSNLLQELTIAKRLGRDQMILDETRLNENPVYRMKRLITTQFWRSLTRLLTRDNIMEMSKDTKIEEEITDENGQVQHNKESHRIYIPYNRKDQFDYFNSIKEANPDISLDVQYLPEIIDADYVKSINKKPGLLALSAAPDPNDSTNLISQPYIVPGGRFNELYGWDSYMETIGLLVDVTVDDQEHLKLARGMTENFIYEIHHYGKILNANRSYYLTRSQPPFLTDMALRVFNKTMEVAPERLEESMDFIRRAIEAAIKEYNNVWFAEPRLDKETGLSCYHPVGKGIPPETEASHFNAILDPYIKKYGISQTDFIEEYNNGTIKEPELDEYFLHDRAVRESGHDTSYRLEGKCADLATVDLNSLLYKYEADIAFVIESLCDGKLENKDTGEIETPEKWREKANLRKKRITKYLWNEEDSIFYDYNIKKKRQTGYESATTFWPLWSQLASAEQADMLVKNSTQKLEEFGGLAAGTLKSRGGINLHRPSRQWDYPYGWAPQQILAWIGLCNYGYEGVARRLAYRWLYLMTQAFVDYNGVVVEKYNVTKGAIPHKVDAEYGNQGLDFKGVAMEGFGWVNASYVFGLTFMNLHACRCLGTLTPPDVFLRYLHPQQRKDYQ